MPPLDGYTASVRSVTPTGNGIVAVSVRLSDGGVRTVCVPTSLATFQGITYTAAAIAQLALILQGPT